MIKIGKWMRRINNLAARTSALLHLTITSPWCPCSLTLSILPMRVHACRATVAAPWLSPPTMAPPSCRVWLARDKACFSAKKALIGTLSLPDGAKCSLSHFNKSLIQETHAWADCSGEMTLQFATVETGNSWIRHLHPSELTSLFFFSLKDCSSLRKPSAKRNSGVTIS